MLKAVLKQSNDLAKDLASVKAEFELAYQQLIRCDPPAAVEQQLGSAGQSLALLKSRTWNEDEKRLAAPLLRELKTKVARIQLLLDTAAAFRCGVALAETVVGETYDADGSWRTIHPNDHICLNA
jgi:hypothetical protein